MRQLGFPVRKSTSRLLEVLKPDLPVSFPKNSYWSSETLCNPSSSVSPLDSPVDAETERSLADCRRVIDFLCVADRVGRSVGRTRTDRQSGVVPFWPL